MIPQKFHTFVDGKVPAGLITAERLNKNFDELYKMFDPEQYGITEENVPTTAKIVISDRSYTGDNKITGNWEFQNFPIVPDGSIPSSKLDNNVPRLNANNTFTGQNSFAQNVNFNLKQLVNARIENVTGLPQGNSARLGQIVFDSQTNRFYGWNGTEWKPLDYVGEYTGGAIRVYATTGDVDSGKAFTMYFKTEGNSPTIYLALKGEKFPPRYYTELGRHTHVFTPSPHNHVIDDPGHNHSVEIGAHDHGNTQFARDTHNHSFGTASQYTGEHGHSFSGTTGYDEARHSHGFSGNTNEGGGSHYHEGVEQGYGSTSSTDISHSHYFSGNTDEGSANHAHYFSGNTSNTGTHAHWVEGNTSSSSTNQQIPPADLGTKISQSSITNITIQSTNANGTVEYAGIDGGQLSTQVKAWANNLRVFIDSTEITNNILQAKGWQKIGDGTQSHPFHTQGTGELNISSWVSLSPGLHVLRIEEPESSCGCQVMVHLETS